MQGNDLTKPQAALLLKAMRADTMAYVQGQQLRTATNLVRKGYLYEGSSGSWRDGYAPTRRGLEVLADYWMRKDAASGCIAFMETRCEVEAALAAAV